MAKKKYDNYTLYEFSVQSPEIHVEFFDFVFKKLRKRRPLSLREDFCGTFFNCTEWIKSFSGRTALGLDLDPKPLAYGKRKHLPELTPAQKKGLKILKKNVVSQTRPLTDICFAGNFSVNVFKEWEALIAYFKAARGSIKRDGLFILEIAGGPGMMEDVRDRKTLSKNGKPWFTYIWDQKSFDPITNFAKYTISFKFLNGPKRKDVFKYDWRLWTIPEVRLAMKIAGYKKSLVFWDPGDGEGNDTGVFFPREKTEREHAWIAYIVGLPNP